MISIKLLEARCTDEALNFDHQKQINSERMYMRRYVLYTKIIYLP